MPHKRAASKSPEPTPIKRGGCLRAFLLVELYIRGGAAFGYTIVALISAWSFWQFGPIVAVLAIGFVAYAGVWNWKKWGAYLYYALCVIGIIVGLALKQSTLLVLILFYLPEPLMLFFLLRPVWNKME